MEEMKARSRKVLADVLEPSVEPSGSPDHGLLRARGPRSVDTTGFPIRVGSAFGVVSAGGDLPTRLIDDHAPLAAHVNDRMDRSGTLTV